MLLSDVVATSRNVGGTSKRLQKVGLLAALLERTPPDEVETVVAFLSGLTRQGRIGVGYASLRAAMASSAAEPSIEVSEVDRALEAVAAVQGPGSETRKRALLGDLLARATVDEQQFLAALLLGEIRQGALEGIMLDALAKASHLSPERVRRAAMMSGSVIQIARPALEQGASGLDRFDLQLFRPVQPMLAQVAEDTESAIEELGQAALEFKLDGARVQVHRSGGDVRVYSRSLNDVTATVPEVVEVARELPGGDLILDGEVIAFAPDGRPQPFQVTARRFGRKLDLEQVRAELPLTPIWFDVLFAAGASLVDEPQHKRFDVLRALSRPRHLIPNLVTGDPGQANEFLRASLDRGHEGIMAKALDSGYVAGARGQSWLKIKKAHTLDLVVLAAEWGNGRRKGWLSNLHLGARQPEKGGFAMLGKTFKGMTDEMLQWQTNYLLSIEIGRDNHTVFVEPKLVAEIAFSDVQISSKYPSGLALRFARVKRYRTDKAAAEADTFQAVQKLAVIPTPP